MSSSTPPDDDSEFVREEVNREGRSDSLPPRSPALPLLGLLLGRSDDTDDGRSRSVLCVIDGKEIVMTYNKTDK